MSNISHESDPLVPKDSPASGLTEPASESEEEMGVMEREPSSESEEEMGVMESIKDAVQEGLGDIVEGVEEAVEELREEIIDEAREVKEALKEELQEVDDGHMFFVEMSLTRNLSILPTDVTHAAEESAEDHQALPLELMKQEVVPGKTPPSAYFLLASAVVALSSIGPLLDRQEGCTPTMKIAWRQSGTAMVLFPLALMQVRQAGKLPHLTPPQWFTFLLAACCYSSMCVGFSLALEYTSVGNAVILSNSQALILLMARLFTGHPVLFLEAAGALIAFGGVVMCSRDSSSTNAGPDGNLTLFGDALGFIAGLGGVGYLVFAKAVRANLDLYVFMFLIMAVGPIIVWTFQKFVLGETITFDRNVNHGVWGFLTWQPDRLPLEITMVLICNMLGSLGYVRAMQYFDNLVISVAALMEPVVAEIMAFSIGVSTLPGWKGWLGNALVAGGTLAVVYQSAKGGGGGHH